MNPRNFFAGLKRRKPRFQTLIADGEAAHAQAQTKP